MCIDVRKTCICGARRVQFHLRDNILPPRVIMNLYCPDCPGNASFNINSMLNDNGWIIEYDMEIAATLIMQKLGTPIETIKPEFIFDQGYACWLELYPGERDDIQQEKAEIIKLLKDDPKRYLTAIQQWNIQRVENLKKAGWRRMLHA